MIRPGNGLLRRANRLWGLALLELFLGPKERKVERGHLDPLHLMAGLLGPLGIGLRERMAIVPALLIRMSLNDRNSLGHRVLPSPCGLEANN